MYSTVQMVRLALIPFPESGYDGSTPPATLSNTAADLPNTQLLDAIAEGDSLIDGYIGGYYKVPVAGVLDTDGVTLVIPHPIDYWSRNLAQYNATLSFRESQDFEDIDPVARRYTATMAALVAVSKGQVALQIPVNTGDSALTGAGGVKNPYVGDLFDPRDFSLRPLNEGWPVWPHVPYGGTW